MAPAGAAATPGPDPADPPARTPLAPAGMEASASPPPAEPDERPARRSRQRTHPARRRVHPALPPTGVDGRCVNTVDSTVGHRHSRGRDRTTVRPARRPWRAGLVADRCRPGAGRAGAHPRRRRRLAREPEDAAVPLGERARHSGGAVPGPARRALCGVGRPPGTGGFRTGRRTRARRAPAGPAGGGRRGRRRGHRAVAHPAHDGPAARRPAGRRRRRRRGARAARAARRRAAAPARPGPAPARRGTARPGLPARGHAGPRRGRPGLGLRPVRPGRRRGRRRRPTSPPRRRSARRRRCSRSARRATRSRSWSTRAWTSPTRPPGFPVELSRAPAPRRASPTRSSTWPRPWQRSRSARERATLHAELARALSTAGRGDEAAAHAREARMLATRIGSRRVLRRLDGQGPSAGSAVSSSASAAR